MITKLRNTIIRTVHGAVEQKNETYAYQFAFALARRRVTSDAKLHHKGGMEGRLGKLRNNTHPKTGARLPDPVEMDEGSITAVKGNYSRIVPPAPSFETFHQSPPEGFYFYDTLGVPSSITVRHPIGCLSQMTTACENPDC